MNAFPDYYKQLDAMNAAIPANIEYHPRFGEAMGGSKDGPRSLRLSRGRSSAVCVTTWRRCPAVCVCVCACHVCMCSVRHVGAQT